MSIPSLLKDKMIKIALPWWQDGETIPDEKKEPYWLTLGIQVFFERVYQWMLYPIGQAEALTCSLSLLNVMAWDRDITRFKGEPIALFRKRVKFAAINAKDAGSVAGFIRIFERLGVGIVDFKERQDPEQWDVCTIELTDSDMAQDAQLVQTLIEQYGRTCRRYRFEVSYPAEIFINHGQFNHVFAMYSAGEPDLKAQLDAKPLPIMHSHQIYSASVDL
ncbi:phage tail protein [uncultured Vibrio sp.]|uniref:phage tail protein n=1 Tax=uncultured Vibrio sp. TaxID=114054 RepID=UPI0025CCF2F5|nr:phage tail protein [uncultured Vibrio sp.]